MTRVSKKATRGRNEKRGPVRIKVAKVIQERGAVLKSQGNRDGLYEDMMLYVKNQVVNPRKRGRPKKILTHMAQHVDSSPKVIYVPSSKDGRQFVPISAMVKKSSHTQIYTTTGINRNQICQSVRGMIQTTAVQPNNKLMVTMDAWRPGPEDGKMVWPDDLKELAAMWDTLPETNMKEVVKWLPSPLYTTDYPQIVQNIHNMIEEWQENVDSKIDQIGAWLQELPHCQKSQLMPKVTSPKVVVEAQPNPLQLCGQWTSLAENQENREP